MPQTALARRDGAAGPETAERAAGPVALRRVFGLSRRQPDGEVALFREPHSQWNPAAEHRRIAGAWIWFVLVVVLPVAIAAAYYFFVAADQYVAEFRFGLRSAEPARAEPGALMQQGMAPLQIGLDSYVVAQYIRSRAIVDDLDHTLDLRRMFSPPTADWVARLHLPVPIEELVKYWRGQVDAFFDPTQRHDRGPRPRLHAARRARSGAGHPRLV